MQAWYFLVEYGTMIILGVMTWFGASKVFIGDFIDDPTSFFNKLNNFVDKWRSLFNVLFGMAGIIAIIPILVDYFSEKHKVCNVAQGLNVRAEYGMKKDIVGYAQNEDQVTFISEVEYDNEGNPWIKVSGKGFSGWVSKKYICTE